MRGPTSRRSTLLVPFALALLVLARPATPAPPDASKPDVKAALLAPRAAAPGSKTTVVVELTLGRGWHVNSHTPSESFLIPTNVTLASGTGRLSSVRYPKHVEKRFAFWEKPLAVYEGTVRFEADLEVPSGAAGKVAISGQLSYQACNDQQCFAPAKIPLEASVGLAPPSKAPSR
ncbi:MAG: protein-disulfide reductase DsbD domain-containing protein [Thermoanaerobaculia bacterium]